jgi:hypothetical protein
VYRAHRTLQIASDFLPRVKAVCCRWRWLLIRRGR